MEVATCSVIDILNLHSSRWRSLNLTATEDTLERFSSLAEPKQLVALDLTATTCRNIAHTLPKFMVESKLNLTHLKLTKFPLTSINIRWDNITHATFSNIAISEGVDFLRRATSLEFYCVVMYGSHDVGFVNPILHHRLRSFEVSPGYRLQSVLEALNLPSLEEWTIDVGLGHTAMAAMQALLKRSGSRLKVLNLHRLHPSSEHLYTLLQSTPSLERMRLIPFQTSACDFPLEILTQILCPGPGSSDISVGSATSASFLPHLQVIEFVKAGPFPWGRIQRLCRQGHRRALKLKVSTAQANITDDTALQLLRLTEEGVKLQIVDLTSGEDFLQNFKKREEVRAGCLV